MWNQSIGLIIFLKIASILTSEDDKIAVDVDSRTSNENWSVGKEYELIFVEATWYTAKQYCTDHDMQLASIKTLKEQQHLDMLIKDRDIGARHFWVAKAALAQKGTLKWTTNANVPLISNRNPSNQCVFWYWTNMELCFALCPLTNEWNYDRCDTKKYFICENSAKDASILDNLKEEASTNETEKELVKSIEDELIKLVDEMMLLDLADALETSTEDTWITFIKGGLYMWLEEEQQKLKPKSLLREEAILLAEELKVIKILENEELRIFVNNKFTILPEEKRLQLLNERFRKWISDEAIKLEEKAKSATNISGKSLWDEMISLLVEQFILLAKEEHDKLASKILIKSEGVKPNNTLDVELMKAIGLDLIKLSEEEFKMYVLEAVNQFEQYGVQEFDMQLLFQIFLLVKQELFTFIAKAASKATLEERIKISSYGLSRILEGNIGLTEQRSIFGPVFVMLASDVVILTEKEFATLNDEDLRTFVKKEFKELKGEDMVHLYHDGYTKFIIDEFIKLSSDPESIQKNESGQLVLDNIISQFASQLFWFVDDEIKIIAEQLSKLRVDESNKYGLVFQVMAQSKGKVHEYDEEKLIKLFSLIELELFKITSKSLGKLSELEIIELVEEGLSKLLAGDIFKSTEGKSVFVKVLNSLAEELSKLTEEEFANLNVDGLYKLVKAQLHLSKYDEEIELFEEASLKLMADEFIKFTNEGRSTLTAEEEGKHQFGEIVKVLAKKLLQIAEIAVNNSQSI